MSPIEIDAIDSAISIASNYFESKGIAITNKTLREIILKWYTKIESPLTLAALAIENPRDVDLSDNTIREIRNLYFPSKNP